MVHSLLCCFPAADPHPSACVMYPGICPSAGNPLPAFMLLVAARSRALMASDVHTSYCLPREGGLHVQPRIIRAPGQR